MQGRIRIGGACVGVGEYHQGLVDRGCGRGRTDPDASKPEIVEAGSEGASERELPVIIEATAVDEKVVVLIDNLAILRLDGDLYGSTMDALNNLYPKLSKGGFCIIDDYALFGCKRAVDDYRAQYKIDTEMKEVDWTCRYWRKE